VVSLVIDRRCYTDGGRSSISVEMTVCETKRCSWKDSQALVANVDVSLGKTLDSKLPP